MGVHSAPWRHLMNAIELSVRGSNSACCLITLTHATVVHLLFCRSSVMLLSVCWSSLLILSIWSSVVSSQRLTTISQNLTVVEEQPGGYVIGQINVPSAIPPYTVYHADQKDARRILVSGSGSVTVGERVDREEKSLYRLIAQASNNVNVEVMLFASVYLSVVLNVKSAAVHRLLCMHHTTIYGHHTAQPGLASTHSHWRILLPAWMMECMPLLMVSSAFELWRICQCSW